MQRFELVEGNSSKFWEVGISGSELTVNYGRIGTAGQSKTKSFASPAAAAAEMAKLIKEKSGKGYQAAGAAAPIPAAPPPPPATAALTTTPAPASAPGDITPPAVAAAPVTEATPDLAWPQGGFEWDPELEAQLPMVRGIHVRPYDRSPPPLSARKDFGTSAQSKYDALVAALVAADCPVPICSLSKSARPWDQVDADQRITRDHLSRPDVDYWNELLIQCGCRYNEQYLSWCFRVGLALHGLPFIVARLLDMAPALATLGDSWTGTRYGFDRLRHAIAASNDSEHAQVLAMAAAARGRHDHVDLLLSYLFPEQADWAEACAARNPGDAAWWLATSATRVATALLAAKASLPHYEYALPAVLLQIRLHGEAALPCLLQLFDRAPERTSAESAAKLLARLKTPALPAALLDRLEAVEIRPLVDQLAEQYPAALLQAAIEKFASTRQRTLETWALRQALHRPAACQAALAACSEPARHRFAALLAAVAPPAEAPAEALPEILRNPPWTRRQALQPAPLPTLAIAPLPLPASTRWPDGLQASWRSYQPSGWPREQWQRDGGQRSFETWLLVDLHIRDTAFERVLAGEPLPATALIHGICFSNIENLLWLPAPAALALWNSLPAEVWGDWRLVEVTQALLARHETQALPGLLRLLHKLPELGLALALPFAAPGIAGTAAHALKHLKKARPGAISWLRRHPEAALHDLLPAAFGEERKVRETAQFAVRWLVDNGCAELAVQVAARHGEAMSAALAALLAADPLHHLPAKLPKLPAFFMAAPLRRPVLNSGEALPVAAIEALGMMLAISSLEAPYAGLDLVKAACTGDSLAEFAWDLFDSWLAAGYPNKESWAFTALGLLGNDETARRLAPKIREWPGESAHARAVTGLDLLAAIGSDVALMHLNAIASKVKFKALQDRAKEKIAAVAEARGFTPEELADRLVPDLGLDEDGSAVLDFGPRRFFVAFDEALKPFVKDEAGTRLKDLPKPNKSDDATLAEAAVERFKALKKDAKAVASLQVIRLELAMCHRRRWPVESFRMFFLEHPLSRHLARRLVWGVYREGQLANAFRVAEDLTLADCHDDLYTLPDDVQIGIAHALDLPADLAGAFGQIFADYEILQPFRQLGRETYTPAADELQAKAVTRFKDKKVAIGAIMGLINRGWERDVALDGGWVGRFIKGLPTGLEINLRLDPGTIVGDLQHEPEQRIPEILVRRTGSWGREGLVDLATLDPVIVSEMIRDADLMAPL